MEHLSKISYVNFYSRRINRAEKIHTAKNLHTKVNDMENFAAICLCLWEFQ